MGDAERVEDKSAVEAFEESLGIKVFPILNMKMIFDEVKDSLKSEIRKAWVEYYEKYGAIKLR
jgi:hypothetical protein